MSSSPELLRTQRRIYRSVLNDLAPLERLKNKEIRDYEKNYKSLFRKKFYPSSKDELLKRIRKSSLIFCGDFHPFPQSQKTFLRLMKESDLEGAVIALECVQQKFQQALARFSAGGLSVEELRSAIQYDEHWPFPWSNYKDIFSFAASHKLPLLALNIDGRKYSSNVLAARDRAAAEVLRREMVNYRKIFVLYGEFHIARKHLPSLLSPEKNIRPLMIYQNEPSLYWKMPEEVNSQKIEVLKFRSDQFCIMNAVPWVKLQSYLDWFEGNSEGGEAGIDHGQAIQNYRKLLAATLRLTKSEDRSIDVYVSENDAFLRKSMRSGEYSLLESRLLKHSLMAGRPLYLPAKGFAFLPVVSTNALAETAAMVLYHQNSEDNFFPLSSQRSFLERFVFHFMVGYLGSKLINPKRKCNEVDDIIAFLAMKEKSPGRSSRMRRKIFRLCLQELDFLYGKRKNGPRFQDWNSILLLESARTIGYILGERCFLAMQGERVPQEEITDLFRTRFESESHVRSVLQGLARKLSPKGLEVLGKNEKL